MGLILRVQNLVRPACLGWLRLSGKYLNVFTKTTTPPQIPLRKTWQAIRLLGGLAIGLTLRPAPQAADASTASTASAEQPTSNAINATRIAVGAFGLENNAVETQRRLAAAGLEATWVADHSRRLWLVYVEAGRETGALGKIRDLGYRDAYYVT